jgi:hypothetical protein
MTGNLPGAGGTGEPQRRNVPSSAVPAGRPAGEHALGVLDAGGGDFRYRVNGEGAASLRMGLMTLSLEEFLRRYLLHVPVPGSRVVRAYGLYAPTKGDALAVCRVQLGHKPVATPAVLDWQTFCQERGDAHPERYPRCGRRLVRRGVVPRSRIPPWRWGFRGGGHEPLATCWRLAA